MSLRFCVPLKNKKQLPSELKMEIANTIKKAFKYLTEKPLPDWTTRKYNFYLIFGKTDDESAPWNSKMWIEEIEPIIDKILDKSPEYKHTGVKAHKHQKQGGSNHLEQVKTGRLGWSQKSHERWTTGNEENIIFEDLEIWTPNATKCEKIQSPPDIYVKIENEGYYFRDRDLQFNVFAIVAIATDLKVDCNSLITGLSEKLNAKRTVYRIRKWNKDKGDKNWNFPYWIMDTVSNRIYRAGNLHDIDFSEVVFEPYWQTVYNND